VAAKPFILAAIKLVIMNHCKSIILVGFLFLSFLSNAQTSEIFSTDEGLFADMIRLPTSLKTSP